MEKTTTDNLEEGLDVPFEQISPDILRAMIEEFVTRE
jgi:hypothetical protein